MRGCFKELQPASVTTTPLPSLPAKIKILGTPAPCKQSRITRASSRNSSYPVISLYIPTCIQNRSLVFPKKKKTIYFLRNPLRIRVYRKYRKYRKYFIVTNSLSLGKNLAKFEERGRILSSSPQGEQVVRIFHTCKNMADTVNGNLGS